MEKQQIIVTCAAGVESVTKKELRDLGFVAPKANDGKITLLGTAEDIAVLNMFLRTGERVLLALDTFDALSFDELFDKVKAYPWSDILPFNARILVNGKSKKSQLFHINSCCSIVKKAILRCLSEKYRRSSFPENGETYRVEFFINKNVVTLTLDTSGAGLHKRGYRDLVGEAPIKETLACALIDLSGFTHDRAFCDPFCGSGTIPVEAALYAHNIAPGFGRRFALENLLIYNADRAKKIRIAEAENIRTDVETRITGSDIDSAAVERAKLNAEHACVAAGRALQEIGCDSRIPRPDFIQSDFTELEAPFDAGLLLCNPPYGERLGDEAEAELLYKRMSCLFKNFPGWEIGVITPHLKFQECIGKHAALLKDIKAGNLDTKFYIYSDKVGSKPQHKVHEKK